MDRWTLKMGTGGHWAYVDADGTGRVFGPKDDAMDINERDRPKLFEKIRRLGKKCVGPSETEIVRPRRRLTL